MLKSTILLLTLLCAGCAALTSEVDDEGLVYHLPRSRLTIAVWEHREEATGRVWYLLGGIGTKDGDSTNVATDEIVETPFPDRKHRYVIKYHANKFSDDRLCMSRATNGLLHDVHFAADDRTPQIVFNISRFLSGAFGPQQAFYTEAKPDEGATIRSRAFSAHVDPFEDSDVEAFNEALRNVLGASLRLDVSRLREIASISKQAWPESCDRRTGCDPRAWRAVCAPENICYRTKLKLPIDLYRGQQMLDRKYTDVINAWDIGAISIERTFMVQKITKLRFQDGALVSAIVRKPSEVEEVSLLPIHILNAALITPSGLLVAALTPNTAASSSATLAAMEKLTEKVADLNKSATSLAPAPTVISNESYKLSCQAGKRGGTTINLLATTPLAEVD